MTALSGGLSVVLDTNILVSALLADGPPALVVDRIADRKIRPCFDDRILSEYWDVLSRPKFHFRALRVDRLIRDMVNIGFSIEVSVPSDFLMPDEEDRKFYDAARIAGALLITGNKKHYPDEPFILTPAAFIKKY
jgi:putative PIN family toxin of toxin-antitoxin system